MSIGLNRHGHSDRQTAIGIRCESGGKGFAPGEGRGHIKQDHSPSSMLRTFSANCRESNGFCRKLTSS